MMNTGRCIYIVYEEHIHMFIISIINIISYEHICDIHMSINYDHIHMSLLDEHRHVSINYEEVTSNVMCSQTVMLKLKSDVFK